MQYHEIMLRGKGQFIIVCFTYKMSNMQKSKMPDEYLNQCWVNVYHIMS